MREEEEIFKFELKTAGKSINVKGMTKIVKFKLEYQKCQKKLKLIMRKQWETRKS